MIEVDSHTEIAGADSASPPYQALSLVVLNMSIQFEYSALPSPTSFRLFKLNPERTKGTLCGTIEVKAITGPDLRFLALSYTWDHPYENDEKSIIQEAYPAPLPSIICNGRRLVVRNNLLDFLKQLSEWQEKSYIWIDAICINQSDENEKGH